MAYRKRGRGRKRKGRKSYGKKKGKRITHLKASRGGYRL